MSLTDFVLDAPARVAYVDTLELSHPSWSQTYRLVRNVAAGLTAALETMEVVDFQYCPMRVTPPTATNGLAMELSVELGDVGELVPAELERVRAAGSWYVRPGLVYRAYRSDDALSGPIVGPWALEVSLVTTTAAGTTLQAKTRASASGRTGRLYQGRLFPTLRTP